MDVSSELAQLRAADTDVDLKRMNLNRSKQLLADNVIPQSQFDTSKAEYDQAVARRDDIKATIAKKTIKAPFSGRLGIRLVSLGQNLKAGQEIVSLQTLDPIFANFLLPQQDLAKIREGMTVRVTNDVLIDDVVEGRITAINSEVDSATRNIRVQATVGNPDERLRPGMYVNAAVIMPSKLNVLAIPATSVLYAPYSDSVFVLEQKPAEQGQPPRIAVRQQFVSLGEQRGDYVAVLSGLKEGDKVVSTGVFKLRNGQSVVVDNSLAPEFKLEPKPEDS
jgi:membrane fusion protein (multidrug efflux system)